MRMIQNIDHGSMTTKILEHARADLATARAQLAGWQGQPAFEGVLGLAACVATVDVTIQSMDSQLRAEPRPASEIEEIVANPIAGTGGQGQEDQAVEPVFEAEEEALAPADPGAVRAMQLGAHPATGVAGMAFCVGAAYLAARVWPILHPSLEVAGWSLAVFFVTAGLYDAIFMAHRMRAQLQGEERLEADGTPGTLHALFAEPVRPAAAAEVSKKLKEAKANVAVLPLIQSVALGSSLYFADLPPDIIVAWVAGVLTSPIIGVTQFANKLPAAAPARSSLTRPAGSPIASATAHAPCRSTPSSTTSTRCTPPCKLPPPRSPRRLAGPYISPWVDPHVILSSPSAPGHPLSTGSTPTCTTVILCLFYAYFMR
jgi:hypothetical protein